ncbi:hypothetical protein [Brachyspira alvinipulli]|uniref:hypothetical protein n=1 Tax=Brachyspira alvinipulli TaxID=84379 RepID=UPI00047F22B8|nr:hypothetical protein [Brachyspira alvinipulli]
MENIEYESNSLYNYDDIIESYDILISLAKKNILTDDISLNKAIVFAINTEKLAVFNHSDDDKNAYEVLVDNKNYRDYALNSSEFKDRVILFDTISYIVYWYKYNAQDSIKALNETLDDNNIKSEDRAKLYGTLGQSYNISYYVTNDTNDLEKAKDFYFKSIEYFENNNYQIIREYSYLQNLAISAKNEEEFLEYTQKYLDLILEDDENIGELGDKINIYLSQYNKKDKGCKFFVIRLLRYCNTFKISQKSKEIAALLISNEKNFIKYNLSSMEDVDIQKEYTLLLYKYNNKEVNTKYFERCYGFMIGKKGTFNEMRMLSLYIIEILMDNESNIDKALDIIEKLSDTSDGYKNTFNELLLSKDSINDKKEWASKVRDKLYM